MKAFSVTGITGTGKTSVVEKLIGEFRLRGFTVGSVKEIHYENFKIDTEGKNTWRHRQAGAATVTALGFHETDVLYPSRLPIYDVLKHYNEDIVALEGVTDALVPNIVCCKEDASPEINTLTVAVSGRYANTHSGEYMGLPVINAITDYKKLADLLLAKMPDLMYDVDPKCCGMCGYDCRTLLSKCLKGEENIEKCVLRHRQLSLKVDGQDIVIVPFVESILKNVIQGVVKELRGYKKGSKIEIGFIDSENAIYQSKKNRVTLAANGVIVKEFTSSEACGNEEKILRILNGNYAPKLIMRKENTLYIEYIEGDIFVDRYINAGKLRMEQLALSLARTVKELYAVTGKITFDENFSNYIIRNSEIIRIDFEETTEGTLINSCAKILAFASLYEASDDSRLAFMGKLADELNVTGKALNTEYKKELEFLSGRWKVPFPAQLYESFIKRVK